MKRILLVLAFLASTATFAQITFQPGYFINNNGNTTECLIKNVAWKDNPAEFEYKTSDGAETQKALIKDVAAFGVQGYKFKRYNVSIDRSYTIMDLMSSSAVPEWETKTAFLKVLVEGNATLYQYEEGNLVKYFISTGDHTAPEQLMYREHRDNGEIRKNNKFRQQLYNIMRDKMPEMAPFEKLRYLKNELVPLFVEYNGNSSEAADLSASQNRSSVNFKITPGVGMAGIIIESRVNNGISYKFDTKPTFRIGAEVEYLMPFNNNKWALFADPNIQFYKSEGSEGVYEWQADYKFIELPFGARHYMFLNADSKLFIDLAFTLSMNVGDPYIQYNAVKVGIEKSSNFAAGAGFAHKRYSAELRYGFGRGLTNLYDTWGATYSSVGLILGYKIF